MTKHNNPVSNEAKAIFADVLIHNRRTLERFLEGFDQALKDVYLYWRRLLNQKDCESRKDLRDLFKKVQDVAKQIMVKQCDGGGAKNENGLTLGTFNGYVCKVKRSLIFRVPLDIAETTTNDILRQAQQKAENTPDTEGSYEERIVKEVENAKKSRREEREKLQREAEANAKRNAAEGRRASMSTPFTLPNPADFEDEDSDQLLNDIVLGMLSLLNTKSIKPHLDKDLPAAEVLKRVRGELTAYANQLEMAVA